MSAEHAPNTGRRSERTTTINTRRALHTRLVGVHRAGLAAETTPETPSNRITRRRAIRNGRRALEDLLADLDGLFRFIARRRTHDPDDLEDLLQVARFHAVRALESWDPDGGAAVTTWVTSYLWAELRTAMGRMRPEGEVLTSFDRTELDDRGFEPAVEDAAFDEVDSVDTVARALIRHRSRIDIDDARHLDEVLCGDIGAAGSAGNRARVRALVAHPTSGVMVELVPATPLARPATPIDIDADAEWLTTHTPQPGWEALAACVDCDKSDYFPERGVAYTDDTLRLCASCPVRLDCLAVGCSEATRPGLWGGQSSKSRLAIRRRVRTSPATAPTTRS